MFFGALLQWLGSILAWLAGLVTLPPPPAFLGEGSGQLATIMHQSEALCRFVDFTMWPAAIQVIITIYIVGLTIRILRVVFGFFVG